MYQNYRVIAIARHQSEELGKLVEQTPLCRFESCDLSEIGKLHHLALMLRSKYGPAYGLINNAGIGSSGILSVMPDDEIDRVISLNLISPIVLTKYLTRQMLVANNGGRIINVASIVALQGYKGLAAYSASKAAMIGFTKSLARELGEVADITVNAVAPGFIATEMTHGLTDKHREQIARRSALRRMATAEDVAEAVAYLMEAKNVTGTVLTVDAGNTA